MKTLLPAVAVFITVSTFTVQVQAQPETDCTVPEATVAMIECASADLQAADKRLNEAYKAVRANLDELGTALLLKAQRAWIKFRDAECERERDAARGGTMAPLLQLSCLTQLTKQRTNDLSDGDMSGTRRSDRNIAWIPGVAADGPFTCTGASIRAQAGLTGGYDIDTDIRRAVAVIGVGDDTLDIPIGDGQEALCGAPVALEVVNQGEGCAVLRVDDGLCDAFFVTFDDLGLLKTERAN